MMRGPVSQVLPQGRRHFQHGPIDIIAYAEGEAASVEHAHEAAWRRFQEILPELVDELPALRQPVGQHCVLNGPIARAMWQACKACQTEPDMFITPMAAVAGSVAQELAAHYRLAGVTRAWVNNGGDIALYLTEGTGVTVGLFADLARLDSQQLREGMGVDASFEVSSAMGISGVATSGWRGRSFSMGIADSVTVFAASAALADAAATVIANAVNVVDSAIVRQAASQLKDDSDLGEREVTVAVPALTDEQIHLALHAGLKKAHELKQIGLICACVLSCQGWVSSTEASTEAAARLGVEATKFERLSRSQYASPNS